MNKIIILILLAVSFIFISGCATQETVEGSDQAVQGSNAEIQEPVQQVEGKTTLPSQGLGNLCSGEEGCISFCENNPGECEGYCQRNTENPLCQKIYSFEGVDKKLRKKTILDENEEKPVLSLPFDRSDEPNGLLPMGETISHNGEPHAGIDFFWNKEAKVLASVDGEIIHIAQRKSGEGEMYEGMWDIFVRTGKYYVIGYTELGIVNPDAYLGKTVRKGEWLGNGNFLHDRWMIHWEFGYYPDGWQGHGGINPKPHPDRLCPMSYFDENSKQRIGEIWDKAPWDHRKEFPHICSGIFEEVTIVTKEVKDEDKKCAGTKIKFDYAPVNLDKTLIMLPLGLMVGGHVTPVDHHYFQNFDNEEFNIEIYSPGDGYITDIGHMPGAEEGKDYRIVIEHTCTISSIYIYVSNLPEKIKENTARKFGDAPMRIPVTAGELIGYYKYNLDYNLVDEEVTLEGFIVPEHYNEEWKIHVPNTYDYFNEPVRSQLIAKSVRTAEPISGKIDYDIDGKLVGNWFLEGTNGYRGTGHLSFAYDYIDPGRIVVSIGRYGGENPEQFGVKGNSPDPSEMGIEDGLIKYELAQYEYITPNGNLWDRKSLAKDLKTQSQEKVQGIALVQMLEDRKIKFEAFPGKTASQVSGFTQNAKIYER